jgi:hypothetical protein
MNRRSAQNIVHSTHLPSVLLLLALLPAGCKGPPEVVLESDVPNVAGYEPLVTRNLQREAGRISGVEVLYRGDIDDPVRQVNDTQARFITQGWTLVSKQARGAATVLNFRKDSRSARVEIAMNQLDPMTSPAHLQVFPTPPPPPPISFSPPTTSAGGASTGAPIEGFAPPTR